MSGMNTDARVGGSFLSSLGAANRLGADLNIPELILAIQVERGQILDKQIKGQMEDMQKRNEWLRDANAALAAMRNNRPTTDSDGKPSYGTFTDANGRKQDVATWARANGIDVPTAPDHHGIKQSQFDAAIQNMKSSIDTVNNQSQMDMVRLQGLMDKRNQAFDMMTNTLSKTGKSLDSVISNMR